MSSESSGNPHDSPLSVTIQDVGGLVSDGNPVYRQGEPGVDHAEINRHGQFVFLASSLTDPPANSRKVFIPDIVLSTGGVLSPGLVDVQLSTPSCCDFREMTATFEETEGLRETVQANPNEFKMGTRFLVDGVRYTLSFGKRECVAGTAFVPDSDPRRGSRVSITRAVTESVEIVERTRGKKTFQDTVTRADTSWAVETMGPAALCGDGMLETGVNMPLLMLLEVN